VTQCQAVPDYNVALSAQCMASAGVQQNSSAQCPANAGVHRSQRSHFEGEEGETWSEIPVVGLYQAWRSLGGRLKGPQAGIRVILAAWEGLRVDRGRLTGF
jgi:hypothetical protein